MNFTLVYGFRIKSGMTDGHEKEFYIKKVFHVKILVKQNLQRVSLDYNTVSHPVMHGYGDLHCLGYSFLRNT